MNSFKDTFHNGMTCLHADFHLHTKADKEFSYDGEANEFVKQYVARLVEEKIQIGVITNHNKFDSGEFKALKKEANKNQVLLLPGIELSINDGANGVHTLIVFSDDWLEGSSGHINQFLGSVFKGKQAQRYEQENGRTTTEGIRTILKELKEYGKDFFVIFAHVEQQSGLWNEIDGGKLSELSQDPLVQQYCLGFQKVRTHDNGEKCRTKVQSWWKSEYPAEVEGSDPKSLQEIGKGNKRTYIKIGAPTFEAVKYALTDHHSRISSEEIIVKHSFIAKISFEGGMFSDQSVNLSPHMNSLIGIRGSGKSAIIECIRYALDIKEGSEDKNYKDKLVAHVLGSGGKITLDLIDDQGATYQISRINKEASKCYKHGDLLEYIDPKSVILKRPLYFGQKDLAKAGDDLGGDSLINKILGNKLRNEREAISSCAQNLQQSLSKFQNINKINEKLEELKKQLSEVNFDISKFEEYNVEEKLKGQSKFLIDKSSANQLYEHVNKAHEQLKSALSQVVNDFNQALKPESPANCEVFSNINKSLKRITNILVQQQELTDKINSEIEKIKSDTEVVCQGYESKKEEFAQIQRDLSIELANKGDREIDVSKYAEFKTDKIKLENEISKLENELKNRENISQNISQNIDLLNKRRHQEFQKIETLLKKLNESQSAIQIVSTYRGDRESFKKQLLDKFKGSGISNSSYDKLVSEFTDFSAIYSDLEKAAGLTGAKSTVFKEYFQKHLPELLAYQVPNLFQVMFHGRPLEEHSLGQRASAMMIFVLNQKDGDVIIIDQPEDDLDNQTIYEDVIKIIRELKLNRQFIFATHNANFPVLGDTEVVISCKETSGGFDLSTNSIDDKDCQSRIIKIMEGGQEAFSKRHQIYQQWQG